MIRTPSNLELLLHCHYSPEPHPRLRAPAIQEGLQHLLTHRMIERNHQQPGEVYTTTQKGYAYINFLMTVPFPEQHWIVPTKSEAG
jgi:hypothetical protein